MSDSQTTGTFNTTTQMAEEELTARLFADTRAEQQKAEAQWRAESRAFAWVDERPVWLSPAAAWSCGLQGWLPTPSGPSTRLFWLSLIGGGWVEVAERWVYSRRTTPFSLDVDQVDLVVRVDLGDDELDHFAGRLHWVGGGMEAVAVVFARTTPQSVVDRIAQTLRAIGRSPANFHALLHGDDGCAFCGGPLPDEFTQLLGLHLHCAEGLGISHDDAAVDKRCELRQALLGIHA
jgi:hypothetical protein